MDRVEFKGVRLTRKDVFSVLSKTSIEIRPKKKYPEFPVTCQKKLGKEGEVFFYVFFYLYT